MDKATDSISNGDTVTVGEGHSLWRVLGFQLRVGGHVMAKVEPIGGGSTMITSIERLRPLGGSR